MIIPDTDYKENSIRRKTRSLDKYVNIGGGVPWEPEIFSGIRL
jgi:hypothetical protein